VLALAALAPIGCRALPEKATVEAALESADAPGARVVWESNRSGRFRIWSAPLDDRGEARQLSPDEPGRDHCCARISPDGERVVYLSIPIERRRYGGPVQPGSLHLVRLEDGRDRRLIDGVRRQGGHRAVVWWDAERFVYIDAAGATRLRDLALGTESVLAAAGEERSGWLVAPGGRYATRGEPSFSPRDPATGRIRQATPLGGCEPTFSADGALGLWVAGAGGPVDVLDLASRESRSIVLRNDPRLPEGRRYLYFPALSSDRSRLAWAASDGTHDHFRADYDVFVAPVDPRTISLVGPPRSIAPHPGVDRYPDVWRTAVEAPMGGLAETDGNSSLALPPPDAPVFLWDSATAPNQRAAGSEAEILDLHGEAWYDRAGRLALAGGRAAVEPASSERIGRALRHTNEFSVALLLEPAELRPESGGPLVALSRGPRERGFVIRQAGTRIELLLRRGKPGEGTPAVPLLQLDDREPRHLAVTFSPGRLTIYVDGERRRSEIVPGDFYFWRQVRLGLGAESGGETRFHGWLAQLRIWDREITEEEVRPVAADAAAIRERLAQVAASTVEARLVARSRQPTLDEISPYTRALAVEEWELLRPVSGEAPPVRFRVARWAILDSTASDASRLPAGATRTLRLEPYAAQPQLESVVLADTLAGADSPLFADVGVAP